MEKRRPERSPALAGIRVLDVTRLLPGGFCTMMLSDLGAEVLKVEDLGAGDYLRWTEPHHEGAELSAKSAVFVALNRGKRSIRIDLKSPAGRELFLKLAAEHDVVVESFRPGVMERLDLGYEVLARRNPALVYCAISGYGPDGEYSQRPGHDLNYLALAGILGLSGEAGGPPAQTSVQIADTAGGSLTAAFGVMAALWEARTSGRGQRVDISMAGGSLSLLSMAAAQSLCSGDVPRRGDEILNGASICYRPYACRDGWVSLGAVEEKFWAEFCRGIGREDLIGNRHDRPGSVAHAELERIFAERTREEWRSFATDHPCCLEPVLDLAEALDSPFAREMIVEIPQPGAHRPVRALDGPVRLSETPAGPAGPAPGLGEHSAEVLRELGCDEAEIDLLFTDGVVAGPPTEAPMSFRV